MAYENLKSAIKQAIKQNGNQEITGSTMQSTLLSIVGNIPEVVQESGKAEDKVMSQKAVSEELRDLYSDIKDIKYLQYTESKYINYENGVFVSTAGSTTEWKATDKIRVAVGTKIVYRFEGLATNVAFIAAYDKQGNYLKNKSVQGGTTFVEGTYIVEEGVYYIAICHYMQYNGTIQPFMQTQIDNLSESVNKSLDDINDLKYLQYTESKYINYENGVFVSTAGSTTEWKATDKIRVAVGTKIVYRFEGLATNVAFIAAYDKQGNYLKNKSVQGGTTFVEGTYIVEEGVYYIAICHYMQYNGTIQPFMQTQIDNLSESVNKPLSYPAYNSCVKKPITFEGKKALFAGDSITYGFTSGTTNVHGTGDYPKIVSEKLGLTYKNAGVAGATITRFDDYGFIKDQIMTAERNDYDILFIAGGINDWQAGAELADFRKAIEDYCSYINNNYPNTTKVIWITPINQAGYRSSIAGGQKYAVQQYRNALTEVVSSNDNFDRFSIIQGSDLNFPTSDADESYITKMFGDSLHPTEYAYKNIYAAGLINLLI